MSEKVIDPFTGLEEAYAAWDGTSTPDANDIGALFAFNEYDYCHAFYHNKADDFVKIATKMVTKAKVVKTLPNC